MPGITKHHSIIHAEKILREVRKIWPKKWDGWLKHWSNGREQGYYLQASLWNEKRSERCEAACVFSEGRSCDGALVMAGRPIQDFHISSHQPTEMVWDNHRAYFYDTTGLKNREWKKKLEGRGDRLAAKYIVKELRRLMAEDLRRWRTRQKERKVA
jgi:hypothetical protein